RARQMPWRGASRRSACAAWRRRSEPVVHRESTENPQRPGGHHGLQLRTQPHPPVRREGGGRDRRVRAEDAAGAADLRDAAGGRGGEEAGRRRSDHRGPPVGFYVPVSLCETVSTYRDSRQNRRSHPTSPTHSLSPLSPYRRNGDRGEREVGEEEGDQRREIETTCCYHVGTRLAGRRTAGGQIGRASCRERGEGWVGAGGGRRGRDG